MGGLNLEYDCSKEVYFSRNRRQTQEIVELFMQLTRAPNIGQNKIAKRSESEIFFAKNCEAKRSENIFRLCEANNFSKLRKIAKNCEIAKKNFKF